MDPRLAVLEKRLAPIDRILAVTGGKGGIGKSMVAANLALALARSGKRVGLLDLDLTAPTDHVILGAYDLEPTEEQGLEPPLFEGIRFLSLTWFAGETPTPMRGADVTNALLELLAITMWGELDVLVIDMPPGLGDAALDAVRHLPRAEYVVVANASKVVRETVRRNLELLGELKVSVVGVVENMSRTESEAIPELAARFGHRFLGRLPWDETLEESVGEAHALVSTPFGVALAKLAAAL